MITKHSAAALTAIMLALLLACCTKNPVWQNDSSETPTDSNFETLTDTNIVNVQWCEVTIMKDSDVTTNDILIKAYLDDNNVKIDAYSQSGKVLICTVGNQKIEGTFKNNLYTFTLPDTTGDIAATIGYLKFSATIGFTKGSYANKATLYINSVKVDSDESISVLAGTDVIYSVRDVADGFIFSGWHNGDVGETISKNETYTVESIYSDVAYYAAVKAVIPPKEGALDGIFTVAADEQGNPTKKVRFSKGNLWYGKIGNSETPTFNFENNQYDTKPSETGIRDESHISHFMWCGTPENAMAMRYDMEWNVATPFFAEKNFTVNGYDYWHTLTNTEWYYLLDRREMITGQVRYTNKTSGITIDNTDTVYYGLFIYPDDYIGKEVGDDTEKWSWEKINSAGIVFLPAAGFRVGTDGDAEVQNVGKDGYYWSAMPGNTQFAFFLYFYINDVLSSCNWNRRQACSVRLVTECQ